MAVTTLYHGAHTAYTLHEGQCYTSDREVAEWFAKRGVVATIEVDLDALVVERCPGYDHGSAIRRMIADSIARTAEQWYGGEA